MWQFVMGFLNFSTMFENISKIYFHSAFPQLGKRNIGKGRCQNIRDTI